MGKNLEIIVKQEVISGLESLVEILFEKEYFSFKESAYRYVDKILLQIYFELGDFPHYNSPLHLSQFVSYYVKIK